MNKKERFAFERIQTLRGVIAVLVLIVLVVVIGDRSTVKYVVTSFTTETQIPTETPPTEAHTELPTENVYTEYPTTEATSEDLPNKITNDKNNITNNKSNITLSVPDKVKRGQSVTITMTGGDAGTEYFLYVCYSSGTSSAKGLQWTTANKDGVCSWTFRIGSSAKLSIGENAKFPYVYVGTRSIEQLSQVYYMTIE